MPPRWRASGEQRQLDLIQARIADGQGFQGSFGAAPRSALGQPGHARARTAEYDQPGTPAGQLIRIQILFPHSRVGKLQFPLDRGRAQYRAV